MKGYQATLLLAFLLLLLAEFYLFSIYLSPNNTAEILKEQAAFYRSLRAIQMLKASTYQAGILGLSTAYLSSSLISDLLFTNFKILIPEDKIREIIVSTFIFAAILWEFSHPPFDGTYFCLPYDFDESVIATMTANISTMWLPSEAVQSSSCLPAAITYLISVPNNISQAKVTVYFYNVSGYKLCYLYFKGKSAKAICPKRPLAISYNKTLCSPTYVVNESVVANAIISSLTLSQNFLPILTSNVVIDCS